MKKWIVLGWAYFLIFSCHNTSEEKEEVERFKDKGDSIATFAQTTLLQNVSNAMQKGGTEYAVEFCQIKALPITDSLSGKYSVAIRRITDQNRNPENGLKTEMDRKVFYAFTLDNSKMDTILRKQDNVVYYKRINLAMPACVKCHGNPQTDINPATLQKIKSLYPDDKATGYAMGDFRGLWKIVMK